jgi:hypothetical protein
MEAFVSYFVVVGACLALPALIVFVATRLTEKEDRTRDMTVPPAQFSTKRAFVVFTCYVLSLEGLVRVFDRGIHTFQYFMAAALVLFLPKAIMLICHVVMSWSWVIGKSTSYILSLVFLSLCIVSLGIPPAHLAITGSAVSFQPVVEFGIRFYIKALGVLPWFALGLFLVYSHLRSKVVVKPKSLLTFLALVPLLMGIGLSWEEFGHGIFIRSKQAGVRIGALALRGKQLRAAIDEADVAEIYDNLMHIPKSNPEKRPEITDPGILFIRFGPTTDISQLIVRFIPIGTTIDDAVAILRSADFDIFHRDKTFRSPPYSGYVGATINHFDWMLFGTSSVIVLLYPQSPGNYSRVDKIEAYVRVTML